MKKALIITYYWPPAGGPGVQRWLKMAKYLPEFGIQPTILTVDSEKATYPLRDETLLEDLPAHLKTFYTDTSELFNLYKKTSGRKEVPFSGFVNESDKPGPRQKISKWIRGNILIPDPRRGWNKYAVKKAREIIKQESIDLIITTSPPHSSQLIGLQLKKEFPQIKWLADLRDPWTDIYYYNQFYPSKLAKQIDLNYEKQVLLKADYISVVSASMKRLLAGKIANNQSDKFLVVPNGFDEDDFKENNKYTSNSIFTITYTGTITSQYQIDSFLTVTEEISKDQNLKLQFVGKRDEHLEKKLMKLNLQNLEVELLSNVAHSKSIKFLQNADALLLGIPDIKDNEGIITGKIFEYLAAKKPIVGIGPVDGDAATILKETDSGEMFDYSNKTEVKQFLKMLMTEQSKFTYQVEAYSRKKLTQQLVNAIR